MNPTTPAIARPHQILFTEAEQLAAYQAWGANCGPNALAVALEITLEKAREVLVGFDLKRYTNPSMMENGLNLLGAAWIRQRGLHLRHGPTRGLARLQWEGRWLDPGVPKVVAYRHTHWVASSAQHVFCTASGYFGWIPLHHYCEYLDTKFCPQNGYRGWHITHHYHVEQA
jgi:hypothetical protein